MPAFQESRARWFGMVQATDPAAPTGAIRVLGGTCGSAGSTMTGRTITRMGREPLLVSPPIRQIRNRLRSLLDKFPVIPTYYSHRLVTA